MKYKNLFFDLDDTLWAFSENSRDTFREMYEKYGFDKHFDSFDHYFGLYESKNEELWDKYSRKEITRDELNDQRFLHPLRAVGVDNPGLAATYKNDYMQVVRTKSKLMPYVKEMLEYLRNKRYNMYIISNGFRELQARKMQASGIDGYFKKVILSEDIGVMKPYPEIFYFALSATQSELKESVMIGDNWNADITGAYEVGMDQIYYDLRGEKNEPAFRPTYVIRDLRELEGIL